MENTQEQPVNFTFNITFNFDAMPPALKERMMK